MWFIARKIIWCKGWLASLPWESLPSLRTCRQAVSRVPSLPFLYCLWSAHSDNDGSVVTSGLAQDNVYYVLNPDKSLKNTEEKIKSVLRQETYSNWEGVVGEIPEKQQLTKALQEKVGRSLIQTSPLLLVGIHRDTVLCLVDTKNAPSREYFPCLELIIFMKFRPECRHIIGEWRSLVFS